MKKLITTAALLITFFSINFDFKAAILTATTNNGEWSDPTVWSSGTAPTCGDTMIVPAGITMFVTSNVNLNTGNPLCSLVRITVAGRLRFDKGAKMNLASGACMTVENGGSIAPSAKGGGSSESISFGNTNEWIASDGVLNGPTQMGCSVLLPVNLISFETELLNNKLKTTWEVASESELLEYQIETSLDGKNWNHFATQRAANSGAKYYSLEENYQSENQIIYVRLKSFTQNGISTQIALTSISNDFYSENELQIFPNPVNGNSNFILLAKNTLNKNVELVVFDQMGKVIITQQFENENSSEKFTLPNQNLNPGSYFISVSDEKQKVTSKFIVI